MTYKGPIGEDRPMPHAVGVSGVAYEIGSDVMIEKVELTNFKGFKKFQLDEFSRMTLLGGKNGVGKTSLLEAIFLFFDRGNPEMLILQSPWRGINKLFLSSDQLFSPVFHDYDRTREIVIGLTVGGKQERVKLRFHDKLPDRMIYYDRPSRGGRAFLAGSEERPVLYGKLSVEYDHGGHSEKSEMIVTERGLRLRDKNAKPERRPVIYISPRAPVTPADDAFRFGELDKRGGVDAASKYLSDFDPRIRRLSSIFYGDSATIHADIGLSQKVPVPHLGDGLNFALSVYLAMSAAKDGFLLIDEIASGLHYSILNNFWKAVSAASRHFNCQLIATTHSYECMDAAVKGLADQARPDFTYVRLDRDEGAVVPTSYSFPILEAAIDSDWEVR